MPIPGFEATMLPMLRVLEDRQEHSLSTVIDVLADGFGLTADERRELLPSGQQSRFDNRMSWARTYMKKAGLIESTRRGFFRITDRGVEVLKAAPAMIDVEFLERFGEFQEFQRVRRERPAGRQEPHGDLETTPEEAMADAYQRMRNELADDVHRQLGSVSPSQFEKIVVDLLVGMGYGGSRKDAAKAIGGKGDEGVDGMINEDRLGLDVIYVQAKKWEGMVGRPEIQKFAGALLGKHAKKGIFITTSEFSKEGREYASGIENKIVLVDGQALVQFMIDHNIGVSTSATYESKKVDLDYFTGG